MAAPSRTVPHPGRALALLLVLILAMLLGILGGKLFSPSQWRDQFKVGLGLDLSSGTQVTLQAQTLSGKPPSSDAMNAAVSVIESRVNGTGNSGAQVQPQGTNLLVVTVPGAGSKQTIQLVSQTALLMFRQVLLYPALQRDQHAPAPAASASASPSASPLGQHLGQRQPGGEFESRPPAPPARRRPPPRSSLTSRPAPRRARPRAPRPARHPARAPARAPVRARPLPLRSPRAPRTARSWAPTRSATRAWSPARAHSRSSTTPS